MISKQYVTSWKTQLTMAIDFICSEDDNVEECVMY